MHNPLAGVWAKVLRMLSPGYGWCFCCERPWKFVVPHPTLWGNSSSCYALCEKCWRELEGPSPYETVVNRLPYYQRLVDQWFRDPNLCKKIENAVYLEVGLPAPWRHVQIQVQDHEIIIPASTGDLEFDEAIKKWQAKL